MADEVRITLSTAAKRALAKPAVWRGGYQTLLRHLQGQIQDGVLTASPADVERMLRYVLSYGSGGFQQRLAAATGRKAAKRKK